MQPEDALAGDLGVGNALQTLGGRPAPDMECPKNRARTGPGAVDQILKYSARFIGTLNQLEHHSLEHSAWPRGPDELTQVFRQVFTCPPVTVGDPELFYIASERSSSVFVTRNMIIEFSFLFLVHDNSHAEYTWYCYMITSYPQTMSSSSGVIKPPMSLESGSNRS